jgi:hypothetical protein
MIRIMQNVINRGDIRDTYKILVGNLNKSVYKGKVKVKLSL